MQESFMLKYFEGSGFLSVDETEVETFLSKNIEEHMEELRFMLNEERLNKVLHLISDITMHMHIIRGEECSKMFHLGIKLGMEIKEFELKEEAK